MKRFSIISPLPGSEIESYCSPSWYRNRTIMPLPAVLRCTTPHETADWGLMYRYTSNVFSQNIKLLLKPER
jgi:hypothetical protein